jgi:hypothetical protein
MSKVENAESGKWGKWKMSTVDCQGSRRLAGRQKAPSLKFDLQSGTVAVRLSEFQKWRFWVQKLP